MRTRAQAHVQGGGWHRQAGQRSALQDCQHGLTALAVRFSRQTVVLLVTLVLALAGLVVTSSPAQAKTNTVILKGSEWLGSNGVDVYSNDGDTNSAEGDLNYVNIGTAERPNNVQSGFRWQCVELVNRLYLSRGWTTVRWAGNGKDMYGSAPSSLQKSPNGSIAAVSPGDIIVMGGGLYKGDDGQPAGHVAIVHSVDGTTINTVSQNMPGDAARQPFIWDKVAKQIKPWSGYTMTGIVHAPGNSTGTNPYSNDHPFTATPPDGSVVENFDGGRHLYVAAGGSLFWAASQNDPAILPFQEEARRRYPTAGQDGHDILPMRNDAVHAIEAHYPHARAHPPRDGTFMYERGSSQQYVMMFGYAWPIGNSQEVEALGGAGKAVMVPPGSIAPLRGIPDNIPDNKLLRAPTEAPVYHTVNGSLQWADNFTVLECLQVVHRAPIRTVPASLLAGLRSAGRVSASNARCAFPAAWAMHGHGGVERWRINSTNPYTRQRYSSPLALACWLGSSPSHIAISVAAINQPPEGPVLGCPDNAYVRNRQNGEVYRVMSGVIHYIPTEPALYCLTHGNLGVIIDVDEPVLAAAPRGPDAECDLENRLLKAPDGRVVWIKGGQRRWVASDIMLNCVKVRAPAGEPIPVSWEVYNLFPEGAGAYCPYPAEVKFVRGEGQTAAWRVYADGTRQHISAYCTDVDPANAGDARYRVYVMPAGEVDGHALREPGVFYASVEACRAIT